MGYNWGMDVDARPQPIAFQRISRWLGWNRTSYALMSGFILLLLLMGYVWWPLAEEYLSYIDWEGEWWRYIDWLLIGIFLAMSLLIMARADLRKDALVIFVGLAGGLVIESWGTQTSIWTYYTFERPPLWIIPAWPIASLSIDRLVRLMARILPGVGTPKGKRDRIYTAVYWGVFISFYVLMLWFVAPTFDKSFTWAALLLVVIFTLVPGDRRLALITFAAGSGLGYFLELWGTTRLCWTYYTLEQPPVFAVFAHGMAAVAFWRTGTWLQAAWGKIYNIKWPGSRIEGFEDSNR